MLARFDEYELWLWSLVEAEECEMMRGAKQRKCVVDVECG